MVLDLHRGEREGGTRGGGGAKEQYQDSGRDKAAGGGEDSQDFVRNRIGRLVLRNRRVQLREMKWARENRL